MNTDQYYGFPKKKIINMNKTKLRTLIMIFILLDGKQHSQSKIKELYNQFYQETPPLKSDADYNKLKDWAKQRIDYIVPNVDYNYDVLFSFIFEIEWLIRQIKQAGTVDDVSISRIADKLDKSKITKRISTKNGQGAYPLLNSLENNYFTLLKIFNLLNQYNWPEYGSLIRVQQIVIMSKYGKNIVNKKLIEKIGSTRGIQFTDDEKNKILMILRSSPTALTNQILRIKNKEKIDRTVKDLQNEEHKKEDLLDELFYDLGRDIRFVLFDPPFDYRIYLKW